MSETEDIYNEGWVSIHRKSIRSSVFDDPLTWKIWTWCLMKSAHTEHSFILGIQEIDQKVGEFVTGIKSACRELKTTENRYRSRIALLEKTGRIVVKTTNKYSTICVVKYEFYQNEARKTTNKQQTNNKQTTTNNNDNNENNLVEATSKGEFPLKDNEENMAFGNKRYKGEERGYEEPAMQIDPDHKPKGKTKKKVSDEIQQVFDLFNNPAKAIWRLREIEREAAKALFEAYGIEKLKIRVDRIEKEKNNKDPMFPLITTPSQLLDKMPNVERYLNI